MQEQNLKSIAFFDIRIEMENTRRLLSRVPEEHFAWKPHEKSFSLGELASHVANLNQWIRMTIEEAGFDLAGNEPGSVAESHAELMDTFDRLSAGALDAFDAASIEDLMESWTLRHGDHEIFSAPKASVLRQWGLSHIIHHRAQLTVYLRELGVPLPALYGPSADEQN